MSSSNSSSSTGILNISLWIAQILIALVFLGSGYVKFMTPIPDLSKIMPWTGQLPVTFVRFIGVVDFAGGCGIILPSLTRIKPNITILAAICCSVLQVLAIAFHTSRGEAAVTPLNYGLLALALFVLWGRSRKVRILPRAVAIT
jgi:uncharacterized membrane protein YphA (DoxX/SURF4 family)